MNLVRLESGQLWHVVWRDNDSILPGKNDTREYLILLLRWDDKEKQWWIVRLRPDGRMRVYPSASMWNEQVVDLDKTSDSYEFRRIA